MDKIYSTSRILHWPNFESIVELKGERYSWIFHRWLRKYCAPDNGSPSELKRLELPLLFQGDGDCQFADQSSYYLGWLEDGEFFGVNLGKILHDSPSNDIQKIPDFTYSDVVADFWADYARFGVCALDKGHKHDLNFPPAGSNNQLLYGIVRWNILVSQPNDFELSPDDPIPTSRTCRWCGLKQINQPRYIKTRQDNWQLEQIESEKPPETIIEDQANA